MRGTKREWVRTEKEVTLSATMMDEPRVEFQIRSNLERGWGEHGVLRSTLKHDFLLCYTVEPLTSNLSG